MSLYNPLNLFSIPPQALDPNPLATSLTVDSFSDVLWVGTSSGTVSAYCSPLTLSRNVQFPAHGSRTAGYAVPGVIRSVNEIQVSDREVWTLTEGGIGGRKRGGAPKWNVSDPARSLRSMTPNPINSHEILAGGTGQMMLVNTSRGEIVRRVSATWAMALTTRLTTVLH